MMYEAEGGTRRRPSVRVSVAAFDPLFCGVLWTIGVGPDTHKHIPDSGPWLSAVNDVRLRRRARPGREREDHSNNWLYAELPSVQ